VNDADSCKLTTPINRINDLAANVSFFYLPDPAFSRKYGKQVLKNHEEFTAMNSPYVTTNHMILSEQLMLKQWLCSDNVPHQSLSKNLWDCKSADFYDGLAESGIWNLKETRRSYKHYGVEERRIRESRAGYNYNETVEFLKRCVTAGKLIDVKELENKINTILNA
jgi:hypothetical protein